MAGRIHTFGDDDRRTVVYEDPDEVAINAMPMYRWHPYGSA